MTRKETLDKTRDDCIKMKETLEGIQEQFIISTREVFIQDMLDEDGFNVDELHNKIKSIFFPTTGFSDNVLNEVCSFMVFMGIF